MHSKNYNNKSKNFIQGLRPFSSSIPKTLKKHLKKGGYNYSNIVDNWTKMVSKKISDACYPITVKMGKEMKDGTLVLNVLHGKELEIEYEKNEIMDKLNMAEKRLPQDGKILMKHKQGQLECRVATLPTVGGNEDAVVRILADSKPIPITKMNFSKRDLNLIQEKVKKPYGLILAVGPTGSGKTTTLHSCLGSINTPNKKIWTAEDPVEITQEGLRQVQMLDKIGLNFAKALRSFLRGDPDVIMVGEMRDAETCSIALEASLTGHLVFSTLHTNSAPETIIRLIDMGMNPLHFADALLVVIAQRLVHTLCKKCKEDYHPTKEEFDLLVEEYGVDKFSSLGIKYKDSLMLKRPVGCKKCEETGLAGRTGLYEVLEGTPELKSLVMKGATVQELRKQAISDGMTTLKQDGIQKVFKGECDLKHVNAVCLF